MTSHYMNTTNQRQFRNKLRTSNIRRNKDSAIYQQNTLRIVTK